MSTPQAEGFGARLRAIIGGTATAEPKPMADPLVDPADEVDEVDEADPADAPVDPVAPPAQDIGQHAVETNVSAVAAEKARWATVMRSDAYAGREDLALDLLADTDLGGDRVVAMLGKMPAAAPVAASTFDEKMTLEAPNPKVTATGGQSGDSTLTPTAVLKARHAKKG